MILTSIEELVHSRSMGQTMPVAPVQSPQTSSRKNIVIIAGILLLVILLVGLIYLKQLKEKTTNPTTISNGSSRAHTTISLHLVQLVNDGKTKAPSIIAIDMDTHGDKVTGDQFVLQFDPAIIMAPSLNVVNSPTFFSNPNVLVKNVDTVKGKITLVEILPLKLTPISGSGSIAGLTFYINPNTTAKSTDIRFVDYAQVSGIIKGYNYLKSVQNVTIPLTK